MLKWNKRAEKVSAPRSADHRRYGAQAATAQDEGVPLRDSDAALRCSINRHDLKPADRRMGETAGGRSLRHGDP